MKKAAILQSNYLPWKGVFDLIHQVDVFVFLEDAQYTTRDWRNRNQILSQNGTRWISVPVKHEHGERQRICDVIIDNNTKWQKQHYNSFQMNYGRAPFYKEYKWIIEDLFLENTWEKLSDLNIYSTKLICEILGIKTLFINSTELKCNGTKDDKLIEICKAINATKYLSGPAGKNYINQKKFDINNISLEYVEYCYPKYKQQYDFFEHHVTILDLIFNCGPDSPYYIWNWREKVDRI